MVFDHGIDSRMDTMPVSKFKATCLAALERVRRTGQPLRITRFGKPVADIVPPSPEPRPKSWLGCMQGTLELRGDIVGPTKPLASWEVLD
jgi:antitoxin (DNA-binding transcriptional repressor) of toxin-antitoxin stability system